jgi:hypothetical protein
MTDEFAKNVAAIPTLLQRCRSIVISRPTELQFFQGFQPLLECLTVATINSILNSPYGPWRSVGERPNLCPKLRTLKLRTADGRKEWPKHLFQQLTELEIYYDNTLPVVTRLRSLSLIIGPGIPRPVVHESLQTLVLEYGLPQGMETPNTLGVIVCPELRRLEIRASCCKRFPSIHLRDAHKLFDLCLECSQAFVYDEEKALRLNEQYNERWSGSIVELLRSIGTIKHLKLKSGMGVVSRLVEKIEADPTLCPDLASLHVEQRLTAPTVRAFKRDRTLLLKLEARIAERYQQLGRE